MSKYIIHLTPSLANNENKLSVNFGDVIIHHYLSKILEDIFTGKEIIEISTHDYLSKKEIHLIQNSALTIIGGSNLLSSDIRSYNQWKTYQRTIDYIFPSIENILLLGVGWWQYQKNPTLLTKLFYRNVLHKNLIHSVRDTYSLNNLKLSGIHNCVNTSCPTTWNLNGQNLSNQTGKNKKCLFALTDYNTDKIVDNELINILMLIYHELYFFPQGTEDEMYLLSLESYKKNKGKIKILERSFGELNSLIAQGGIDYVGTRLHLGIHCLNNNINSLIISIDNRASEIQKDINLPCIERISLKKIYDWNNRKLQFSPICLPNESINIWKNQFSQITSAI
jgi:polysaccharide pyruvyl transferase WcaK-like protein